MGATVNGSLARLSNPLPRARDALARRSRRRRFERLLWRRQFVEIALARAAATSSLRDLDPTDPLSWSFSGCSQNEEDGIIDYLTRRIREPNRYFVEIGASDGMENNAAWLAIARRYGGLMVEGDAASSIASHQLISGPGGLNIRVESLQLFVTRENATEIVRRSLHPNPDVFSIDIDGNDYYVMEAVLQAGFRPRICAVEYNSAFGPTECVTIEYSEAHAVDFDDVGGSLYYGVSINGWRHFFASHGYRFVTVEASGINAFFVDASEFDEEFTSALRGLEFQENGWQRMRTRLGWEEQFELIADRPLVRLDCDTAP